MSPHADDSVKVTDVISENFDDVGLATISIGKLINGDRDTERELLKAGQDLGFFYLDVRDHPSRDVADQIKLVESAALQFYDLPQEAKSKWEANKDHVEGEEIVMGYKPAGVQTGAVAGKGDGFEGFLIFEHALHNASREKPLDGPKIFQERRDLLEEVTTSLGDMGRVILDSLSRSLQLEGPRSLSPHHRKGYSSTTALGLLKYLPYTLQSESVGHVSHTDIGSLSMVFSDVGGLQVYHPTQKSWMYVPPKAGHTVCNVGDSVEFMSKNLLRSSLHRVIPHPAEKHKSKLTVVYLMRPETDTVFVDREGKEWTSVDFYNRKNRLFAEDLKSQTSNVATMGGLGHDDSWDERME